MNVLVVGGAGYIGSHCTRQLVESGNNPVVLDNLVYGHKAAVAEDIPFYNCDLGDRDRVEAVLRDHQIEVVMHFAAFAYVGESVQDPLKYYRNNVAEPIALLEAMKKTGVRKFVFSSSCATYGVPTGLPITENMPKNPISPYGQTKLDMEQILVASVAAYGMSSASFRYFNAAGASEDGLIGEDHDPETHLIPLAIWAAMGLRPELQVFGDDYPTPDGSCLRDYIHVDDLSRAHIAVFDNLERRGESHFYNLGTGTPTSVKEIIRTVESVTGLRVPVRIGGRRSGDPPALYASADKAKAELDWEIKYPDIRTIIETAWNWHKDHPKGYGD